MFLALWEELRKLTLASRLITYLSNLVVFEYFYDVYLFEIKHVCKLNWPKRPSEVLSFHL
jgi:hypothetical protein